MSQQQHDEIDLVYVIGKLKKTVKNWISLAFKGLDYALKYWYVILLLLILGFGYAWLKTEDLKPNRSARLIVKVNYNLQNYVTNAFEAFNREVGDRDIVLLNKLEFDTINPPIYYVEYEPIIDYRDILNNYEVNERGLEILLRNVDFDDDDITAKDYFENNYVFYKVDFFLNKKSTPKDIDRFFEFINNNKNLKGFKEQSVLNINTNIEENKKSIDLINKVLESYSNSSTQNAMTEKLSLDINPNINNLVEYKTYLLKQNAKLLNNLALSSEIAYPLSKANIVKEPLSILQRKKIMYPILFVFTFLLISYLRYLYFYFRKIAKENT